MFDSSKSIIFSICSINYISYARTLFNSITKYHGSEFSLLLILVDENESRIEFSEQNFDVLEVKYLGILNFNNLSYKYNIMELNTAVKPFVFEYLLEKGYRSILYLDPDILLFDRIDFIFDCLESKSIILTPHITNPITDNCRPSEQDFLKTGTYNLGFIAISSSEISIRFISWWCEKCRNLCLNEPETGLFVDQKWINLVPGLFRNVEVVHDPRFNMAYWNLHERYLHGLDVNNNGRLVFFHFSGFLVDNIEVISKYQNRFTLDKRTDLKEIFELYKNLLISNGYYQTREIVCKYSYYDNGNVIEDIHRSLYFDFQGEYSDPFRVGKNSFYSKIVSNGLLTQASVNSADLSKYHRWNVLINRGLRYLKFLFGARRYLLLIRYLNWVTVRRRQSFLIKN
jgi:hypothetical protein